MSKQYFRRGVPNDGNGGGRPVGSRDRLTRKFLYELAEDFEKNGAGVIKIVRLEKPDIYLRCVASLIPKEFAIADTKLGDMSDEEIVELLATVRELRAKAAAEDQDSEPALH